MTEATFWAGTVRPKLGMFGTLRRIENRVGEGTPDVLYCLRRSARHGDLPASTGLIELKHAYAWPERDTTPMLFNHFTLEQAAWLEDWHRCGGRCCVLAQVADDYLLVPPWHARRLQVGVARPEFLALTAVHGHGRFPTADVVRWLTGMVN